MSDVTFEPPHHQPRRGSDVEAFIKAERDQYFRPKGERTINTIGAYYALDDLLERYRLRADTGSWLWEEVSYGPEDP